MPTLDGNYLEFAGATGFELGYGRDAAAWTAEQAAVVHENLRSAQRMVYYPEITGTNGRVESHNWSFLTVYGSAPLASGEYLVPLPADLGDIAGRLTVETGKQFTPPVRLSAETRAMRHRHPATTGYPKMAELEWVDGTGAGYGQRRRLHVWPTADQAYTLNFYYKVSPDALADTRPFAFGGPAHAETFKAACLAAVEFYVDGQKGTRYDYFVRRLAASVSIDRNSKPDLLGYNGDNSDGRAGWRWNDRYAWFEGPAVTYNGSPLQ